MLGKTHTSDHENPETPGPSSAQVESHPTVHPKASGISHLIFNALVAGEFHLNSYFLFRDSSVFILRSKNYKSDCLLQPEKQFLGHIKSPLLHPSLSSFPLPNPSAIPMFTAWFVPFHTFLPTLIKIHKHHFTHRKCLLQLLISSK